MPGRALVTGAGGFIGGYLVSYLKEQGWWVRGADLKHPEFGETDADEFVLCDLREQSTSVCEGIDEVYALAADMGGMGFISKDPATIMRNNMLINLNTIEAARLSGVRRYFLASSACIYPEHVQDTEANSGLREEDAFPAAPQDSYGWEKLTAELLCTYYREQYGLPVRIARYHNVYGPLGTYDGGREKAPAALCRKVAEAGDDGVVEIWGDGEQTRSFCYVSDCVEGTYRLMRSEIEKPLNIGSDRLISINDLCRLVQEVAGRPNLKLVHVPGPQGVRGRNSDNTRIERELGWTPKVPLEDGIARTYEWIERMVRPEVLA
jgi:GDP-D-mannose 3',5'-epimerase